MIIFKPLIWFSHKVKAAHGLPLVIFLLIYLAWFHLIEVIPRKRYMTIILPIDRKIPFCELFVVPYLSWFCYIAVGCFLLYYLDRHAFDGVTTYLMIGMSLFLLVSTFLPNRQPLRLLEMPRDNFFTALVAKVWRTDTPTNVWPSIHVFNSLAVESWMLRSDHHFFKKNWVRATGLIWCVLICFSTVLIKQHSLFDVITAVLAIAACYLYVVICQQVFHFPKWDAWCKSLERRYLRDGE
jgi:membrane-associated phospholipid phosphatase